MRQFLFQLLRANIKILLPGVCIIGLTALCTPTYASVIQSANQPSLREESWTILYTDSVVKVSFTNIVCSGVNAMKLKVESLSSETINFTYKLDAASDASRLITMYPHQILEGLCAPEYKNLLIEPYPVSGLDSIKFLINYK